jgi:hypothetical protein
LRRRAFKAGTGGYFALPSSSKVIVTREVHRVGTVRNEIGKSQVVRTSRSPQVGDGEWAGF